MVKTNLERPFDISVDFNRDVMPILCPRRGIFFLGTGKKSCLEDGSTGAVAIFEAVVEAAKLDC
jgi:hypothetical protein